MCPNDGLKHPSRYICNDITDPCPEPWSCYRGEACCMSSSFLRKWYTFEVNPKLFLKDTNCAFFSETVNPPANNFPPVNIEMNNHVPFNQQDFHPPESRPVDISTSTASSKKVITDPFETTREQISISTPFSSDPLFQTSTTVNQPTKTRSFYLLRSSDIADKEIREFLNLNPMSTTPQDIITPLKFIDQTNFTDIFLNKEPFADTTISSEKTTLDKGITQIPFQTMRTTETVSSPKTSTLNTLPTTHLLTSVTQQTTILPLSKKSNPTWITEKGTNFPNLPINHWPAVNIDQNVSTSRSIWKTTHTTFTTVHRSIPNGTEFFTSSILQTTTPKPKPTQAKTSSTLFPKVTKHQTTVSTKSDFFLKLFASKKPHPSSNSKPELSLSKDGRNETLALNGTVSDSNNLMWQHWKKNAHFSLGSMSGSVQKVSAKFPSQAEDKDFLARLAGYNGKKLCFRNCL